MSKWHLIQNQPLLREIYKEPPPMLEQNSCSEQISLKITIL